MPEVSDDSSSTNTISWGQQPNEHSILQAEQTHNVSTESLLIILVTLHWAQLSLLMFLLSPTREPWTWTSAPVVASQVPSRSWGEEITFLNLLATPPPRRHSMLLAFFTLFVQNLISHSYSSGILALFLQSCFLGSQCQVVLLHRAIPSQLEDSILTFAGIHKVSVSPFFHLLRPPEGGNLNPSVNQLLPQCSASLLEQ